nr:hypothetical protein [Tanacetum cinerariifolium]
MGVKEKIQGDGGAHSLGNSGALTDMGAARSSNIVDDVGKDSNGLNLSPTKVTPGNSIVNKEDNLHDENHGLTPSKSSANQNKGTSYANLFIGGPRNHVAYLVVGDYSWGRSSYARALIEVQADVELKENIMVAIPKLVGEGFYSCNVCVETSNLTSKKANFSGSSFWNVESSTSTTLIIELIDKMKRLIIDGKVTLVDDKGKPLKKVDSLGDHDSDDEISSVNNDMSNFLSSKKKKKNDVKARTTLLLSLPDEH